MLLLTGFTCCFEDSKMGPARPVRQLALQFEATFVSLELVFIEQLEELVAKGART